MSRITTFLLLGVILGLLSGAFGHSYLTNPQSRSNQKNSLTGCRGPSCLGPCDAPKSRASANPPTIQRGASISVQWPRNNHAGGFIRIAWAPTDSSDIHASFDNGVQEIACHERGGCKPDNPTDFNGGDSGPADGSSQPCQLSITVPKHLPDGKYTMQWAWFGGAFALGDYYSCADYTISGGATAAQVPAFFLGGDYQYPNQQKCKYFNTDRLHACVNEPCNNPIYSGGSERSGMPYGLTNGPNVTVSSSTSSSSSSSSSSTSTTGPRPATTAMRPVTTGIKTPVTTGVFIPSPSPVGTNCAGTTTLSQSIATITLVDTWTNTIRIVINLKVVESTLSNWLVQIIWPANAVQTRILSVYNAGALQCESTSPVRHAMIKPVATWANNLVSGASVDIELQAVNTNMLKQFIQANTIVKVFRT